MAVYHRFHVRPRLVDFTMDEPFDHAAAPLRIDRIGVEVVFHDVVGAHQDGRQRARHQITVWIVWMADTDVPVGVEDAFLGEDAIGRDKVLDERRIDRAPGSRRALCGSKTESGSQKQTGCDRYADRMNHLFLRGSDGLLYIA